MTSTLPFAVACLVLFVVFRGLTAPRAGLPVFLRLALGLLAAFFVTLWLVWVRCDRWAILLVAAAVALGSTGIQGDAMARLGEKLGVYRFALYLLSVATLSALVYLFVPTTTFLTSPGELGIHLEYLLTVNVRDAMVLVYAAAALYALAASPRMRTALTLLAMGSLVLALLYSTLLPFGFPMMAGFEFEQISVPASSRFLRSAVDLVLVVVVGMALRKSLLRFGARPFLVALVLAGVSLGVAAGVAASGEQVGGTGGPLAATDLPERPLRFSPEKPNVLIVFLDRFMGSYVESILAGDPTLAERLSGFTWFPRTVSAGQNSIAGLHPMLGGYDYTPTQMNSRRKPLVDLSTEAFSILPYNFSRRGYRVNVINPGGLGFTMQGDCSFLSMDGVTCTHIPPAVVKRRAEQMGFPLRKVSESSSADLLVLLASMRSAPYLLKDVVHERGPWRPYLDHSAGTTFRVWAELKAFPDLSFTEASESNLNIISNILPHEPYYLGEDCQPAMRRLEPPESQRGPTSVFAWQHANAARCTLLMTADFLDRLKADAVYDNTKIVIVSDHGIVGDVEDRSSRAVAGGTTANAFVRTRSLLLVKEIGAEGRLRVSEDYLPNAEVPRIVCEEIGGCVNPFLGDRAIAALGRDDPFFISIVPWQFSLQHPDAFVIEKQLVLTGKDPFQSSGWSAVE